MKIGDRVIEIAQPDSPPATVSDVFINSIGDRFVRVKYMRSGKEVESVLLPESRLTAAPKSMPLRYRRDYEKS